MKNKHLLLFFIIILVSCQTIDKSIPTSFAETPPESTKPVIPIFPSPTPTPTIPIIIDTQLFSGPGNLDFDVITVLQKNTGVVPIATYGDFDKVFIPSIQEEGFILDTALAADTPPLPSLSNIDVPWIKKDIAEYLIGPWLSTNGTVAIYADPTNNGRGQGGGPIQLFDSAKITVQLSTDNGNGLLIFSEHLFMGISNGVYFYELRENEESQAAIHEELPYLEGQLLTIFFHDSYGKHFSFVDSTEKTILDIDLSKRSDLPLPDGLFPDQKMVVFCYVDPQTALTMEEHLLEISPSGVFQEPSPEIPDLRSLSEAHGITIGSPIDLWYMGDYRFEEVTKRVFNLAEITSFGDPYYWIQPGEYDFGFMDKVINFTREKGFKLRVLHLVAGNYSSIPDWLKIGDYTREEYISFLEDYVKTNVSRYQDQVSKWSLANEVANSYGVSGHDFWMDKIGPEYVDMVFKWAKESDPDGILILNADNNECPRDPRSQVIFNEMYELVRGMKSRNVPIDGIGMEMHILLPWNSNTLPTTDCVIETMKKYGNLGVNTYITEFDVTTITIPGSPEEKIEKEAVIYGNMMDACLESEYCKSFSTFGVGDSETWLQTIPRITKLVSDENILAPLMFDTEYRPKPAFDAVYNSLMTH